MTLKTHDDLRRLFIVISFASLLLVLPIANSAREIVEFIVLIFVATFGVSHGSLDWLLARHWGIRRTRIQGLVFLATYSSIVLLTLILWQWLPTMSFVIFMIISIIHFANDWKDEFSRFSRLILGVAVVSTPAIAFQNDIFRVFQVLIPSVYAAYFSSMLHGAGYFALAGACLLVFQKLQKSRLLALEIVTLLLISIMLSPLIYFSIYFCLLHSTKHWLLMKRMGLYQQVSQSLWSAVWPTIICIVCGIVYCFTSKIWSFNEAMLRAIFVGLSALTMPHWLLLEVYPYIVGHQKPHAFFS